MSFGPPPSIYTQSTLAADRARRRRRLQLLGAMAAVAAVVGCVGGWLALSDGDAPDHRTPAAAVQKPDEIRDTVETDPVSPEGQPVVEHKEADLAANSDTNPRYAPGTWATEKILAKGVANRIEGYRIEPGYDDVAWKLKLSGHLCATSRHVTADGRTAVVVQPPTPAGAKTKGVCDQVVFVDLDTGEKLWQAKMPNAGSAFVTNTNLTLTEGVVAVAWGEGSVAYDMKTGKQLWNSTSVSRCEDRGFAGGGALLALEACGPLPDTRYRVQKLDPRTGRAEWTYRLAAGVQDVYLPSSDPPVLAVAAGDTLVTDLITLDDHGKHLATISMSGYDPKCEDRYFGAGYFGVVENCDGVVAGRTQVYVLSKENFDAGQAPDWIVAFNRKTGRTAGKFEGRDRQMVCPLRMSGDDLLVYRRSGDPVQPAAVVRWNPSTDKETPLLLFQLPEDEEYDLSDPEQSDMVYEQGRMFFAKRELVRDDKAPKDPVLLALGIGSAGLKH
ncbi:PQQ-binding-like beta-propeller repeat protein [Streptomyces sp. NPDC000987]|uniref:outer membrane protein assembly factor BamB family protein n=1 Tax=Streptomyces sp. NPDC000987 TaxID=3154374 RepID=UPI0033214991